MNASPGIRCYFALHQISHRLIDENQVICAETLKVKNMLRNRKLARALADSSIGELLRQLEYKADWYGRTFVQVDQWFASSKTCYDCSHKVESLPLSVRSWACSDCGTDHERDINAAKNILSEGLRLLTGEAVGRTATKHVEPDTLVSAAA